LATEFFPVFFLPLLFDCAPHHRDLHSFPTRRSSDLVGSGSGLHLPGAGEGQAAVCLRRKGASRALKEGGVAGHLLRKLERLLAQDRKSTRLNSSHLGISYAVFCLKKKKTKINIYNQI